MIEKAIATQFVRHLNLEEFLDKELGRANYSHIDIKKTPISTRIIIFAEKPGLVIGPGGQKIKELTQKLKEMNVDNPILEVEEIKDVYSDARLVAKNIARMIEKGINYKKAANLYLEKMKNSGIIGAEIRISGKLSGERSRMEKMSFGYIKKCGELSKQIDEAIEIAVTKPGVIGIKVTITKSMSEAVDIGKLEAPEKLSDESKAEETKMPEEFEKIFENVNEILSKKIEDVKKFVEKAENEFGRNEKRFLEILKKMIEEEKKGKNRKSLLNYFESFYTPESKMKEESEIRG
jgi:small subunit ribosomal protein S3